MGFGAEQARQGWLLFVKKAEARPIQLRSMKIDGIVLRPPRLRCSR
jgi:hypothetical protein